MTQRIFRAIFLVAVCVFLASGALAVGLLYGYFSQVQTRQLQSQCDLAVQGIQGQGYAYFEGLSSSCRITWVDEAGYVLYDTDSSAAEMENHAQREEIRQALDTGTGQSSRYSDTRMRQMLYYARRLSDGTVIRVAAERSTVLQLLTEMLMPMVLVGIVALVLSLILASRLAKSIVKPLEELNLDAPAQTQTYEELKPVLQRIENQQQLRREFTANVSHELKTPLHAISGYAELMSSGMVRQEDVPRFSQTIYGESQRMIRLVEDILRLSQLDEGAENLQWSNVDLLAVVKEAVSGLQSAADAAGVSLTVTGEAVSLRAIRQLVTITVQNLCDNAIKYNRSGGRVTVGVTRNGNRAVLTVTDTGIGIPKEYQERIFERFYRVDKSRSKEVGGTGLGLSIVKHAAEVLNATVTLESEPGAGTTVTMTFPGETEV